MKIPEDKLEEARDYYEQYLAFLEAGLTKKQARVDGFCPGHEYWSTRFTRRRFDELLGNVRSALATKIMVDMDDGDEGTDFKPKRRIRDSAAIERKVVSEPICRACGLEKAVDGHHVLLRSQGGDDLEDNIVALCRACHRDYHDARIGIRLSLDERLYVLTKLGRGRDGVS